jgi:hypothetical protein
MNKAEKPVKGCPTDLKKETLHIENGECGLQDGRHFLDQVFNGIGDGISILDIDLNIIRVNKAITGWYPHMKTIWEKNAMKSTRDAQGPVTPAPPSMPLKANNWNQLESYIKEHSEAEFSHSICQDCMKKHHPEFHSTDR